MFSSSRLALILSIAAVAAADQPWKDKQPAEWSDQDAKLVMTSSPWARNVTPSAIVQQNNGQRRSGRGMSGGGIGVGLPGIGGIGRRGPMGGGGGRYPRQSPPRDDSENNGEATPSLSLRWESALPIQAAELKTRADQPNVDADHYAIAIYGIPNRIMGNDSKNTVGELKKLAVLKRDGKKDIKPSSVDVLRREDGAVVVFHFPKKAEISAKDKRIEFDAQIARFKIEESFYVEDMTYNGKLEL